MYSATSSNGVLPDVLDPTCVTPDRDRDWDKHSCSSLSEVSVACLQDRIMQMEETHYRYSFIVKWVFIFSVVFTVIQDI